MATSDLDLKIPKKELAQEKEQAKETFKELTINDIPATFQDDAKEDLANLEKEYQEKIQSLKVECEKVKSNYLNDVIETYKLAKSALDEANKTKKLKLSLSVPCSDCYFKSANFWKKNYPGKWKVVCKVYNDLKSNGWEPFLNFENFEYYNGTKYMVGCSLILNCSFD
ncbi:MAG: hypothetical protein QW478_01025 [Candidatus Micrarchaeaceae archaeon]